MKTKRTIEIRIETARDAETHDLKEIKCRFDALDDDLLDDGNEVEAQAFESLLSERETLRAKRKTYIDALEWVLE